MKNELLYNYNLNIENIKKIDEYKYSFYIDYDKYYLLRIQRPIEDIEEIYKILLTQQHQYHTIIQNKFGTLFFKHDDLIYILIKINGPENREIDIKDIIDTPRIIKKSSTLDRSDWNKLWTQKIDYLEYQISELGKNHPIIRSSFSYYIGLAENAIQYFNSIKLENVKKTLSHRRIKYPVISLNYNDSLDLIIDYKIRDIAEYMKTKFFHEDITREIKYIINKNLLTPSEYNLLFARLLYPSYYFDEVNEILENGKDENILIHYIDKIDAYEQFLNELYHMINKNARLINVDWLTKKS